MVRGFVIAGILALLVSSPADSAPAFLDGVEFFDPLSGGPLDLGRVDDDTVEGFELLYATPGAQDASEIAGHILLRVRLVNNPVAAAAGLENPNDLVVSFLADTSADGDHSEEHPRSSDALAPYRCREKKPGEEKVDKFDPFQATVQAVKGLSGGYAAMFDRSTLFATVKRYTLDEDRTLVRYRLNLSASQRHDLLARLYKTKDEDHFRYYFFDRNCASILVRVIGEGVGDPEVASFDALVLPPNVLVALLERRGLIEPVGPAFFSYKTQAQAAQDLIAAGRDELERRRPDLAWPPAGKLFWGDEEERAMAYFHLALNGRLDSSLAPDVERIYRLAPAAERLHLDKEEACLDYTSRAVAEIRKASRRGMLVASTRAEPMSSPTVVSSERTPLVDGSLHTGLAKTSVAFGVGTGGRPTTALRGGLYSQDMGSTSRHAMQRATAIRFMEGEVFVSRNDDAEASAPVAWEATGLKLRKFRERLDEVPPTLASNGTFGYGLGAMQADVDPNALTSDVRVVEGEGLWNLASTRFYDNYFYLFSGPSLDVLRETNETADGFAPGRWAAGASGGMEALGSLGTARRWQAKLSLSGERLTDKDAAVIKHLKQASLSYLVGPVLTSDLTVRFTVSEKHWLSPRTNAKARLALLGLEVTPW